MNRATTAIAIGTFDGFHRGHRLLVETLIAIARRRKMRSVVVTFEKPVRHVSGLLTTLDEKLSLLRQCAVDEIVVLSAGQSLTGQSADEFFSSFICGELNAGQVVVGQNFTFGHGRTGNVRWLRRHGPAAGVRSTIVRPSCFHRQVISSSRIRALVQKGRIKYVNRLLGRLYSFDGMPVPGRKIGRQLGFPTINLQVDPAKLLPRGVYVAVAEQGPALYPAVMNIGVRPTFEGAEAVLPEIHLLDYAGAWPGAQTRIHLCDHIRRERTFNGREELKIQLAHDVAAARRYFHLNESYSMR